MEKKKMIVNAAVCDVRNMKEETLSRYETVQINTNVMVSSSRAQEIISGCGNVELNAVTVCVTDEENVLLKQINGSFELSGETAAKEKTILVLNGNLTIKPQSADAIENYIAIVVNGSLLCPEAMSPLLQQIQANGNITLYPDEAVVLKDNMQIGRVFALRARNSLYWSRRLLFLDTAVDAAGLREKGVRFAGKQVIMAESLAEPLIDLISEDADIIVVPDGTSFVNGDETLSAELIARWGTRIYVNGDLDIRDAAAEVLSSLTYLHVTGETTVYKEYIAQLAAVSGIRADIKIIDKSKERQYDTIISDKPWVKIDTFMLERNPGGLLVSDCGIVKLAKNVGPDLILDQLSLRGCGVIRCSGNQEGAVFMIAEDCGRISAADSRGSDGPDAAQDGGAEGGGLLKDLFGAAKELGDTKMINAEEYRF